jgi:hypothetical protein
MSFRRFADGISRREYFVVVRPGFSNETDSLALRLWDKPNNLTHIPLELLESRPVPDAYLS